MTRAEEARLQIENPNAIEHADVPAEGVIVFIACLIGSIIVILLIVWGLFAAFRSMRTEAQPFPTPKASMAPPEPRIQYAPRMDLQTLRAQEDAILHTYGWVDRSSGTVRIPIDRAMDIIAQRGLPARSGTGPVPTVPSTGPESGGPQTGRPVPRGAPPRMPQPHAFVAHASACCGELQFAVRRAEARGSTLNRAPRSLMTDPGDRTSGAEK